LVCADWDLKGGTSGTINMETFLGWLLDVTFEGGGLGDAYIAEGLAEALLLCQLIPKLVMLLFHLGINHAKIIN
jgi:hypothetical protein